MTTSLALAALGMIAVVGAVLTDCENKNEAQGGPPGKGPSDQNRPERPSDSPSKRPSSNETSSSENSSSSSVPTEFPVAGDEFVSNDPTVSEEEEVGWKPEETMQNKTNWCYAVCAIRLADGNYTQEVADGLAEYIKKMEIVENRQYGSDGNANGMRSLAVGYEPGYGFYCDPTQQYIATYHSYNSNNEKQQYDEQNNNNENSSLKTLVHITGKSVATSGFDEGWVITNENGEEVLNMPYVETHFLEPLKRGKIILDAFPKDESGEYVKGHTYVVESYDAASGLATLYDPWWGETITGAEDKVIGVNYTFTIERLFLTGFWTRAFVNGKVAYGRSTVYFSKGINEA